jgi:Asp-tRNA(Asn)/Glu-tRNA(Gln) amidotransferase A subunit family amidase
MTKPHLTPDPHRLSATAARAAMDKGRLDSETLVRACLARIDARQGTVHAWEAVERLDSVSRAQALDKLSRQSPLHGIPIGVKDLIDTAALPTTYGSAIYRGHRPKKDAACVKALAAAGGIVLGKTVSTEFAYFTPGPTANPHAPAHTPGGSSSGSAAAVADGQVTLAIGTQTAGSVIRPAAFCGVAGYKGSSGWAPMEGIKPFSPSLDTLGFFARAVADFDLIRRAFGAKPIPGLAGAATGPAPKIAFCRTPHWRVADEDTKRMFERVVVKLSKAGARVTQYDMPTEFAGLNEAQIAIMAKEATRSLAVEREKHADALSAKLKELLDRGDKVGAREETAAKALATKCRNLLAQGFRDFDLILTPAAPGAAPEGLESTGDPVFNRAWTLLGNPCLALPAGRAENGLPLAIQLVGRRGEDAEAIRAAAWIEAALAA